MTTDIHDFYKPCDERTSTTKAMELISTPTTNPARRWFGIGNGVYSTLFTLFPVAVAATGPHSAVSATAAGCILLSWAVSAIVRNGIDDKKTEEFRSVDFEFAASVANQKRPPYSPVLKAFGDGALRGFRNNGVTVCAKSIVVGLAMGISVLATSYKYAAQSIRALNRDIGGAPNTPLTGFKDLFDKTNDQMTNLIDCPMLVMVPRTYKQAIPCLRPALESRDPV